MYSKSALELFQSIKLWKSSVWELHIRGISAVSG